MLMYYLPPDFDLVVGPLIEEKFSLAYAFTSTYLWYLSMDRLVPVVIRLLENIKPSSMEDIYAMSRILGPIFPKFSRKEELLDEVCFIYS